MSARVWRRRRDPSWFRRGGAWWQRYRMADGRIAERTSAVLGGRRGGRWL